MNIVISGRRKTRIFPASEWAAAAQAYRESKPLRGPRPGRAPDRRRPFRKARTHGSQQLTPGRPTDAVLASLRRALRGFRDAPFKRQEEPTLLGSQLAARLGVEVDTFRRLVPPGCRTWPAVRRHLAARLRAGERLPIDSETVLLIVE
jgi:hypothetical protein